MDFALEMGVDFIALSFCRSKQDLLTLKKFLKNKSENVETFVKVEDQEGLSKPDEIKKLRWRYGSPRRFGDRNRHN